jgi:hypothetical protein
VQFICGFQLRNVGGYCHKSIWDNFADQFNNNAGVSSGEEGQNAEDNAYLDVIQAPHLLTVPWQESRGF